MSRTSDDKQTNQPTNLKLHLLLKTQPYRVKVELGLGLLFGLGVKYPGGEMSRGISPALGRRS